MKDLRVLAASSAPETHPLPALKASRWPGWRRHGASPSPSSPEHRQPVHSASPQPLPAPRHRQPVQEGQARGGKVSTCRGWRGGAGVSPAGSTSQPARPARQTEGSKGQGAIPAQLAWGLEGHGTGPRSGTWRGAGRPGGHQGVSCASFLLGFSGAQLPFLLMCE